MWAALWLVPGAKAKADQFVLFDVTFTYTKEDADNSNPSKSHFYVKGDMLNPIQTIHDLRMRSHGSPFRSSIPPLDRLSDPDRVQLA